MDGLRWAVNVRLKYHVRLVNWPIQIKQENGQIGVRCAPNDQVQTGLTELTIEVLPVVRGDALILLKLFLAIGPLSKALQVGKFHGASAFARCDERIPTFFLVFKTDPTALARLYDLLDHLCIECLVERPPQARSIACWRSTIQTEVYRILSSSLTAEVDSFGHSAF